MKIFENMEFVDLAVYTNRTLIVSDFHIGYEEALNKQGILMPRFQFKEVIERLEAIFKKLKGRRIEKIVILGDLKHEFGAISEQEWRHTLRLLDYLGQHLKISDKKFSVSKKSQSDFSGHCEEIILIKGNHYTILGPIAEKRNVKVRDYYLIEPIKNDKRMPIAKKTNKQAPTTKENNNKNRQKIINITGRALKNPIIKKNSQKSTGKILCLHGDKIPPKELLEGVSTIIIGHEHPAVSIKNGPRAELFKCFLAGKWKRKDLIVVPAFNLVTEGTDIMKEKVLSPFLKGKLRNFNVVVAADRLYDFGKVRDLS